MFSYLETMLISFSNILSVPWFVFIASIVVEVVAPIPSPTVMVIAGSVASVQSYTIQGLLILAFVELPERSYVIVRGFLNPWSFVHCQ